MKKKIAKNNSEELVLQISKDFPFLNLSDFSSEYSEIKNQMIEAVNQLLDSNFNNLLNALYRIDISEEKLKIILSLASPKDGAPQIVDLIITRELEKIETRRKYST